VGWLVGIHCNKMLDIPVVFSWNLNSGQVTATVLLLGSPEVSGGPESHALDCVA